jgi:hypothetical protein
MYLNYLFTIDITTLIVKNSPITPSVYHLVLGSIISEIMKFPIESIWSKDTGFCILALKAFSNLIIKHQHRTTYNR